jgi:hypothetical protein
MSEVRKQGFSGEWIVLADLVRFVGEDKKTAKGLKLSKNDGALFAQAYEGDKRITLKLSEAEALLFAMAIIKNYLK